MIEITLVPTEHVGKVWEEVAPLLELAVARSGGRTDIMDVFHDVLDGEQSLWIALDGCMIIGCATIRINKYTTGLTTLAYEYLAGEDVKRWIYQAHEVMQRYAKEYGATRLEVPLGRKGWGPILKEIGYKAHAVRYEMEL